MESQNTSRTIVPKGKGEEDKEEGSQEIKSKQAIPKLRDQESKCVVLRAYRRDFNVIRQPEYQQSATNESGPVSRRLRLIDYCTLPKYSYHSYHVKIKEPLQNDQKPKLKIINTSL